MIKGNKRKMLLLAALTGIFTVSLLSFSPIKQQDRNLKVLPKNISDEKLDQIMDEFKADLGVKCNYCHSPQQPKSSDANPKKDICRTMIRMTDEMNLKYVSLIPHADTVKLQLVNCNTCHRGQAIPSVK